MKTPWYGLIVLLLRDPCMGDMLSKKMVQSFQKKKKKMVQNSIFTLLTHVWGALGALILEVILNVFWHIFEAFQIRLCLVVHARVDAHMRACSMARTRMRVCIAFLTHLNEPPFPGFIVSFLEHNLFNKGLRSWSLLWLTRCGATWYVVETFDDPSSQGWGSGFPYFLPSLDQFHWCGPVTRGLPNSLASARLGQTSLSLTVKSSAIIDMVGLTHDWMCPWS